MIGERIKQLRNAHSMTQEELGKLIGVGKSTINKYELGKIAIPSAKIEALAVALHVSPGYLMGWESKDWENASEEVKRAAEQAAFRAEMGEFTADEMFVTRTYRHATKYEQSLLYGVAVLVTKAANGQHQEEASPDGQIAAASLTRQYLQAQSQRETVEK